MIPSKKLIRRRIYIHEGDPNYPALSSLENVEKYFSPSQYGKYKLSLLFAGGKYVQKYIEVPVPTLPIDEFVNVIEDTSNKGGYSEVHISHDGDSGPHLVFTGWTEMSKEMQKEAKKLITEHEQEVAAQQQHDRAVRIEKAKSILIQEGILTQKA